MSQEPSRGAGWRRHWRWAAPGAVAVVVAGGVGLSGVTAGASQPLPERSAEELLTDVQNARVDGLSGTVVQTSNLGLPDLGSASAELNSTLAGTHTWRVWYGGEDKARLSLVGARGESNIIRNGNQMWTWSSASKEAVQHTLPEHESKTPELSNPAATASPQEATTELLKALSPTTRVSTDGTGEVAGRPVYELVLTPRTQDTLVDSVRIAVDAQEKVPLRVQVRSKKAGDPAFEVGFSSVDFSVPEARNFQFTPPEGTTVKTADEATAEGGHPAPDGPAEGSDPAQQPQNAPTIIGEGWAAVAVGSLPAEQAGLLSGSADPAPAEEAGPRRGPHGEQGPSDLAGIVAQLPQKSGDWGSGRVLEGTLFSVIVTDDGRYAAGAVPVSALEAALARS